MKETVVMPWLDGAERAVAFMPDGTTSLFARILADGRADLAVRGPLRSAFYKVAHASALVVRVTFHPGGAYPFFGVPIDALAGETVAVEQLWPERASELTERLQRVKTAHEVVSLVERALVDRLREGAFEPPSPVAARAAVGLLARGDASVSETAEALGLSERHLRRAFLATVGLSPKRYAKVARFQRALEASRSSAGRAWGDVAREAGYFDQSHLAADFRDLTGAPPGSLTRDGQPAAGRWPRAPVRC